MNSKKITPQVKKTFNTINFGCRVNAAETNQLSQQLVDQGYEYSLDNPDTIIVNTCVITKKGEYESISKIKKLARNNPNTKIIATGCADLDKVSQLKNVTVLKNSDKDEIKTSYSPNISDKFSHTNRYLLKVQSGCSVNCTFCIVPTRRTTLNSLSIEDAIKTVNEAVDNGYKEIIITGVNLAQYLPGLSNLVELLLKETKIELISFGSVPLLCIDDKFIKLFTTYSSRLTNFLHIPLQSGSDKILKLMHRPYDRQKILSTIKNCKLIIKNLSLGTDIIVGFPTETDRDFQDTYNLCKSIGFTKIHVFKYSPRPDTPARELFLNSPKISKPKLSDRSIQIHNLTINKPVI